MGVHVANGFLVGGIAHRVQSDRPRRGIVLGLNIGHRLCVAALLTTVGPVNSLQTVDIREIYVRYTNSILGFWWQMPMAQGVKHPAAAFTISQDILEKNAPPGKTKPPASGRGGFLRAAAGATMGTLNVRGLEPLALRLFPSQFARPADRFRLLACFLLGGFFVMLLELHFPKNAFALQLLLQGTERLIDVVVANTNLHCGCHHLPKFELHFVQEVGV